MTYSDVIQQIYSLSEEMLKSSLQSEWEAVVALESERQSFLDKLADIEPQVYDAELEKQLQQIIAINSEIEELSQQEMDHCRSEHSLVKNHKSAIDAYSSMR